MYERARQKRRVEKHLARLEEYQSSALVCVGQARLKDALFPLVA